MLMTHKIALLALFLAAATANAATTITFSPAVPTPGQTVTATIRSTWSDSCVPTAATVAVSGRLIRIAAVVNPCNQGCLAVLTDYTLTVTFTAPASTGPSSPYDPPYDVEYVTVDCSGNRRLQGTARLNVSLAQCPFEQSLRADKPSVHVGEATNITWCNPTIVIPDSSFTVNFYRVYYSSSPNGPFTRAIDVPGPMTTFAQFTGEAALIGTVYVYVEAHGTRANIGGQGTPAILVSNIVTIQVTQQGGCVVDPTTLCLAEGRFAVRARFRTPASGDNGDGRPVTLTNDSGYFWFFTPGNVEITAKLLDACSTSTPRFWFFAAGMTNVQVELTVTDTKTNTTKLYTTALNTPFAPILDTNAFATCP